MMSLHWNLIYDAPAPPAFMYLQFFFFSLLASRMGESPDVLKSLY